MVLIRLLGPISKLASNYVLRIITNNGFIFGRVSRYLPNVGAHSSRVRFII